MLNLNQKQRRFLLILAVFWLVATIVAVVVNRSLGPQRWQGWPESPPLSLYTLALFVPIVVFLLWRPVFAALSGWPTPHRVLLFVFLGTVFLGHVSNAARHTFPFMDWQMFTRPFEPRAIVHYEFIGWREDGTEVELIPVRIFPVLASGRFYVGFRRFGEILSHQENPPPAMWETYDKVLVALARRYNRSHPANRVVAVEVRRIEVSPAGTSKSEIQVRDFRQAQVPQSVTD